MNRNQTSLSGRHRYNNTVMRRRNVPAGVTPNSLFEVATSEAYRHKWIESEKAGYDIGDRAIEDWHRRFWYTFVRERWIQHVRGQTYWRELDNNDFGLLNTEEMIKYRPLIDQIIDKLEKGGENLDIVQWATNTGQDMTKVLAILSKLDLNAHRIQSQWDSGTEFVKNIQARHRPRVLVVDDDPDMRKLLRRLFEYEQMDVVEASTGEEAMEVVQSRRFDLFVLDLRLPKRHGAEIAYYLRQHGVHRFIVAIGASLDEWHECDLYDCGFTHLLKKPFHLERMALIARDVIQSLAHN